MISTRSLTHLPDIPELLRITKGLAALDAIASAARALRYYSFSCMWGESSGEQWASMRNARGDNWFILFSPAGAAIKGFTRECYMNPLRRRLDVKLFRQRGMLLYPGVLDGFPDAFSALFGLGFLRPEELTFALWRLAGAPGWSVGDIAWPTPDQLREFGNPDADGSERLLSILEGNPEDYASWATAYYGRPFRAEDVARVLAHEPLDDQLVERLGSDRSLFELQDDLYDIGYPCVKMLVMSGDQGSAEAPFVRVADPDTNRVLVLDDDGKVAYAYLLDGEEATAGVWLYNVAPTPDEMDWEDSSKFPFLNPRQYCGTEPPVRLTEFPKITCRWTHTGVEVMFDGVLMARLERGSRPGWSRCAAKPGPLAKPLSDATD